MEGWGRGQKEGQAGEGRRRGRDEGAGMER